MLLTNNFEVRSLNVLWYLNEENVPEMIPNIYDNEEVVRVYQGTGGYMDYPITGSIMYIPVLGIVLFKTQNDAAAYMSIINTLEGCDIAVTNALQASRLSDANKEYSSWGIPDGVYCSEYLDSDNVSWGGLTELRYLNEENLIKKPKPIPKHLESKLSNYLMQFNIALKHNFETERILFEIHSEGGKTYINHFFIAANQFDFNGPIIFTRMMNYPIFSSKEEAAIYRMNIEDGDMSIGTPMAANQSSLQSIKSVYDKERARKDLIIKIGKMCGEYAYSHLQEIIDFGKNKLFNSKSKKRKKK